MMDFKTLFEERIGQLVNQYNCFMELLDGVRNTFGDDAADRVSSNSFLNDTITLLSERIFDCDVQLLKDFFFECDCSLAKMGYVNLEEFYFACREESLNEVVE